MRFELMHKDIPVADVIISDTMGSVVSVERIIEPDHMPLGTGSGIAEANANLNRWWLSRIIPMSRSGIRHFLDAVDASTVSSLLLKGNGLSLSDHYWIRREGSDASWEDISFFRKGFSMQAGEILIGNPGPIPEEYSTPDITSPGNLPKRWIQRSDGFFLMKGAGQNGQEPFNEAIASRCMEALGIDHVDYSVEWDSDRPFSVCRDFVDEGSEFVTASQVLRASQPDGGDGLYGRYVSSCAALGVDAVPFLDRMIVADYLLCNQDRHMGNFGLVRDPDTASEYRMAPLFDHGDSLGNSHPTPMIMKRSVGPCHPFAPSFDEEISLVRDLSWVDEQAVREFPGIVDDVLSDCRGTISDGRIASIIELAESRADSLSALIRGN